MDNVQTGDFEKHKNELKSFVDLAVTSTKIDLSKTMSGLLGLAEHKVSGDELNCLLIDVQSYFDEIKEREENVIKEFGQVYKTFEALDKEYIQGILTDIEFAEESVKKVENSITDIDEAMKALGLKVQKNGEAFRELKSENSIIRRKINTDIDDAMRTLNLKVQNHEDGFRTSKYENSILKRKFERKIYVSYMIAGFAIGLSAIQLILLLLKIL